VLHVQVVFYEVLLQECEFIKNDFNFPCYSDYSEKFLLLFSKKAIFWQHWAACTHVFVIFIDVVAKIVHHLSNQIIEADKWSKNEEQN